MPDITEASREVVNDVTITEYDLSSLPPEQRVTEGSKQIVSLNYPPGTQSIRKYAVNGAVLESWRINEIETGEPSLQIGYHTQHDPAGILEVVRGTERPDELGWECGIQVPDGLRIPKGFYLMPLFSSYLEEEAEMIANTVFVRVNGRDLSLTSPPESQDLPALDGATQANLMFNPMNGGVLRAATELLEGTAHPHLAPHARFILDREIEGVG